MISILSKCECLTSSNINQLLFLTIFFLDILHFIFSFHLLVTFLNITWIIVLLSLRFLILFLVFVGILLLLFRGLFIFLIIEVMHDLITFSPNVTDQLFNLNMIFIEINAHPVHMLAKLIFQLNPITFTILVDRNPKIYQEYEKPLQFFWFPSIQLHILTLLHLKIKPAFFIFDFHNSTHQLLKSTSSIITGRKFMEHSILIDIVLFHLIEREFMIVSDLCIISITIPINTS